MADFLKNLNDLRIPHELKDFAGECYLIYTPRILKNDIEIKARVKKFHFMACNVIRNDFDRGRILSYRLTKNLTGYFSMYDGSRQRLQVCKHCLKEFNNGRGWQDYSTVSRSLQKQILERFNIKEFFSECHFQNMIDKKYFDAIWFGLHNPDDYPSNWNVISNFQRELKKWTCEICGIDLSAEEYHKFLDVHHKNGFKSDVRSENLQVLCKECHSKQYRHEHLKYIDDYKKAIEILNQIRGCNSEGQYEIKF